MKKNNITIDDLAAMVQKEFVAVHQKFFNLEKKLNDNDQQIIKRLEGIVYRNEFETLEIRVRELEDLLAVNHKR